MGSMTPATPAEVLVGEAVPGATVAEPGVPTVPEGVPSDPGAETGERNTPEETEGEVEPAAKRQKFTLEEQCERLVTKLEQSFEVNKDALVAVEDFLLLHQKLAQDVSSLASEYGYDRTSNKHMLAELQSIMTKFSNMEWQLSGAKSEQSSSVKGLLIKILAKVGSSNDAAKKYHEELIKALQEMARAITSMPSTGGMPPGSVSETPPMPKATLGSPPEYRPSSAAGPPMPVYGQPGYSSTGFPPTMPGATMPGATMPGAPMAGAPTVDQPPRALHPTSGILS